MSEYLLFLIMKPNSTKIRRIKLLLKTKIGKSSVKKKLKKNYLKMAKISIFHFRILRILRYIITIE